MKKSKKLIIGLMLLFALVGIVSAAASSISEYGTLKNEYDGKQTVKRNIISGEAVIGKTIRASVSNISNVQGINSNGGIRVQVEAKRKGLFGIYGSIGKDFYSNHNLYPTPDVHPDMDLFMNTDSKELTKIEWSNWTGNTSFYAKFTANSV